MLFHLARGDCIDPADANVIADERTLEAKTALADLNRRSSHQNGIIKIEGTESEWVGPSPQELGRYNKLDNDSAAKMYEMAVPKISNRLLKPLD